MSIHRCGWTALGLVGWLAAGCAGSSHQARPSKAGTASPVVVARPLAAPKVPARPLVVPPPTVAPVPVTPTVATPPPPTAVVLPPEYREPALGPEPEVFLPEPVTPVVAAVPAPKPPEKPRFVVPEHPRVEALVRELSGPHRRAFAAALHRSGRYLPMIRRVLAEAGLPEDLAWLALVESHFFPGARSRAGAVGLWQFIDTTARAEGLRVDWWVDERLDPEVATHAAARHLSGLYARFGDWNLALAAYNAGAGGVERALRRTGLDTYWELVAAGALRSETSRYVPKFYATVALARNPEKYGLDSTDREVPDAYETLEVDAPVDLVTLGRLSGTTAARLRALNPALLRGCTPPGALAYPVRLVPGTLTSVAQRLAALPAGDRLSFRRYRLRSGDTLWGVGRRFGTRPKAIAELNGLGDPRLLRPGREIVVPVTAGALKPGKRSADRAFGRPTYTVRGGDSVWRVARRFGVEVGDVLRWNRLGRAGVIRPGDVLVVGTGRRPAPVAGGGRVHVVRMGETLWALSRRYRVTLEDLLRWNGLSGDAVLRPGDRLRVENGPS